MEKEEKELLKKALCYYLPFGLKGQMENNEGILATYKLEGVKWGYVYVSETGKTWGYTEERSIERFKPYLRPMSNMTEDERKEYNDIVKNTIDFYDCPKSEEICFFIIPIDWLNAHHFDYRGLIPKGLALEAPEGMY